jgi:malonate-semialdehyde dehydrogenase (acetylating)/methylmalonate-semialdehyde dehydrogenase
LINGAECGCQACLSTASGTAARRFRSETQAGNIGINIGVAAPTAFFPLSGWKVSCFGDLRAQGLDAVKFFMQKKVVIERWPKERTRKF